MIRVRTGQVLRITSNDETIQRLFVQCEGSQTEAVNYPQLTGVAHLGDSVTINTTAVTLGLGTGGSHFVMAIHGQSRDPQVAGHIMKMRYSPAQVKVLAVEEEASPSHAVMSEPCDLAGMPVAVATLHSLVAPFACAFKRIAPKCRLAYIMTDGAALPAAFSKLLQALRNEQLIDVVITCGHAFGGDIEAVTAYSAYQAAQVVAGCDACIVAMGPGVVGTGTSLGTTSLEQAPLLDGAGALGACTLAVPRISFADPRSRHQGLSHHTATALGRLAQLPTTVVFPELPCELKEQLEQSCRQANITPKHLLQWEPVNNVDAILSEAGIKVTSMGRSPNQDPAFFASAAAAGQVSAKRCIQSKG